MSLFRTIRQCFSTEQIKHFLQFQGGFDQVIEKVNILECDKGRLLAEMKVDKDHVNSMNSLHGGLSATLVDSLSSFALITDEKNYLVPSVSVNIHLSYLKGANIGDEIVIEANTVRSGKTLGFLTCELRNKKTGDLLVKASHTKYFIRPKD